MIGFFDSGVGGLAIWKTSNSLLPHEPTMYLSDAKYNPYGEKSTQFIRERSKKITDFLVKQGATTIVIACNTATVSSDIHHLRRTFPSISFVGVEPPIKVICLKTQTKEVLLCVTPLTSASSNVQKLIAHFKNQTTVRILAPKTWAKLVEDNADKQTLSQQIQSDLAAFTHLPIDFIGLGCTHYSFLTNEIQQMFPSAQVFDPAEAVATQVKKLQPVHKSFSSQPIHRFLTTGKPEVFRKQLLDLLSRETTVESIDI